MKRGGAAPVVSDPDDAAAAEATALRILRGASQSAASLQRRLQQRGYTSAAAADAVTRCRERGYVDDSALAVALTERMRRAGRGRTRVAAELRARGLDRAVVDAALGTLEASEDAAALSVARKLLEREMRRDPRDAGIRRRVAAGMQRRGYSSSVIAGALRAVSSEGR